MIFCWCISEFAWTNKKYYIFLYSKTRRLLRTSSIFLSVIVLRFSHFSLAPGCRFPLTGFTDFSCINDPAYLRVSPYGYSLLESLKWICLSIHWSFAKYFTRVISPRWSKQLYIDNDRSNNVIRNIYNGPRRGRTIKTPALPLKNILSYQILARNNTHCVIYRGRQNNMITM